MNKKLCDSREYCSPRIFALRQKYDSLNSNKILLGSGQTDVGSPK